MRPARSESALTPAEAHELLRTTSRTFALAVPLLNGPTRTSVELAYLLFRCADTLEDAAAWTVPRRQRALEAFSSMLDADAGCDPAVVAAWLAGGVSRHEGYRRLLAELPRVLAAVERLTPAAASAIRSHSRRTALGMREMVAATSAGLRSIAELRSYCYVVAGIVGELLTTLFVQDAPALSSVLDELVAEQTRFGEALQLVNVLKDEVDDAGEGRSYLPPGVDRAEVCALAADDLLGARRYIAALKRGGAPPSVIAFTSFPCELAEETLRALRVQGAGAKVSRARVMAMFLRYSALSAASAQS